MKKVFLTIFAASVVLGARAMDEELSRSVRSVVMRGDAQEIGLFFIETGLMQRQSINAPIGIETNNILMYAGSPEAFMFLVGVGANPDAKNKYGETVLDLLHYREDKGWIKKGTLAAAKQYMQDREEANRIRANC